jgi:hypothetical protein
MKSFTKPFLTATFTPNNALPIAADAGRFHIRGWVYAGYVDDPQTNVESGSTDVAVLVGSSPSQGSSVFQVLATIKATGVLTRIDEKVQMILGRTVPLKPGWDRPSFGVYRRGTPPSRQVLLFARNTESEPQYWWIDNHGDSERPDLRMTRPPILNTALIAVMFNVDALRVLRNVGQAHRHLGVELQHKSV